MTWTEFKEAAWFLSTMAGLLSPLLVWLWKRGDAKANDADGRLRALQAENDRLEAQAVQRDIEGIRAEVQAYHADIRLFIEKANDAMSRSKSSEQMCAAFDARLRALEGRHG